MNDILAEDPGTPPHTPGYRIKIMRKEKGWNQAELAKRLGVQPPMVSMYESNQSSPSSAAWKEMAEIFGVSLDWLHCVIEIRNPAKQLEVFNFPEDVLELARKLTAMPNGIRRELAGYVDEMATAIITTRASQLERLKRRAQGDPDFEKRTGVKITD